MSKFIRVVSWSALSIILLLAGCAETQQPTPKPPTKVVPVFNPIPTPTPYKFSTAIPRGDLEANQVEVDDNFFFPAVITVPVGTAVHWMHVGDVAHNVESISRTWGVAVFSTGGAYKYTFTTVGTFEYVCTFHQPGMRGTVVVVPK